MCSKSFSKVLKIYCSSSNHYFNYALSDRFCHHSNTVAPVKVSVPKRIHRSPTAVLEAINSTIKRDPNAAHYKYHDDPFLIPVSNLNKRSFALSKESGRKAARWIRDKHGELFNHQPDDPVIEAFLPKEEITEESDASEEVLEKMIATAQVNDAITIYNICQSKGIEIGQKTKQALLEFLCFFNCEDTLDRDWVEEAWYSQGISRLDRPRKTWKDKGLAEELFNSFDPKDTPAYCAIIRGMARFNQVDVAWQMYEEALRENIPLDTETFNAILHIVPFLKEGSEARWLLLLDIIKTMAFCGVTPNLGTMNGMLSSLSLTAGWRQSRTGALQILAEFKDIEPSLATFFYIINIFCRDRGRRSYILEDILNLIEGKELTLQDVKDVQFFVKAMEICRYHLEDMGTANRLHKLLLTGKNYNLIGDSYKESVYYRHYLLLACATETVDNVMALYEDVVPHVYTPEVSVLAEISKVISDQGAFEHLPKLWSDIVMFGSSLMDKVLMAVLESVDQYTPQSHQSELNTRIATVAWDIWTRVQNQDEDARQKAELSGKMVSQLIKTLLALNEFNKAAMIMKKKSLDSSVIGDILPEAVESLVDTAINKQDSFTAVVCVSYAVEKVFPNAQDMVDRVSKSFSKLPVEQRAKLSSLAAKLQM